MIGVYICQFCEVKNKTTTLINIIEFINHLDEHIVEERNDPGKINYPFIKAVAKYRNNLTAMKEIALFIIENT